jgi:hypothetical protein
LQREVSLVLIGRFKLNLFRSIVAGMQALRRLISAIGATHRPITLDPHDDKSNACAEGSLSDYRLKLITSLAPISDERSSLKGRRRPISRGSFRLRLDENTK